MEKKVYETPRLIDFQAENWGSGADTCDDGSCAGVICSPTGCDANSWCKNGGTTNNCGMGTYVS
ncbi:hypothetical protein JCM10550A_02170 [Methanogenium cariaci]